MKKKFNAEEAEKKWAQLIAKCWNDESFKKRFMEQPRQVLEEWELDFYPSSIKYKIVENSKDTVYLVIPQKKDAMTVSDLKNISAACSCSSFGC